MEYTQVGSWLLDGWVEQALKDINGAASTADIASTMNRANQVSVSTRAVANACHRLALAGKAVRYRNQRGVKYTLPNSPPPVDATYLWSLELEPVIKKIVRENPWILAGEIQGLLAQQEIEITGRMIGVFLGLYRWVKIHRKSVGTLYALEGTPIVSRHRAVNPKPLSIDTEALELAVMDIVATYEPLTPTELLEKLIAEGHKNLNATALGKITTNYDWLAKKRTNRGYILTTR